MIRVIEITIRKEGRLIEHIVIGGRKASGISINNNLANLEMDIANPKPAVVAMAQSTAPFSLCACK